MTSNHSTDGREWAKLSALKEGDRVEIDGGFTCMAAGARLVKKDKDGELYLDCEDGGHYLDGQADDGEHCIGIHPAS